MIARDKYLMLIRQSNEPIKEIKHLFFSAIMTDVTIMNDDISLWHIFESAV
jgi:hypothetical protein